MSNLGKIITDIAPTPENLRNSEGAFIRMNDRRIAFVWSRYRDGRHDGDTSDLAVMFSSDEGESWSEPRVMARCEEWGAVNIMSTSLLHLNDGGIAVLVVHHRREVSGHHVEVGVCYTPAFLVNREAKSLRRVKPFLLR